MYKKVLFVLFGLLAFHVSAEPKIANSIAYTVSYNALSVSDPDGATDSTSEVLPYNIEWLGRLSKSTRYSIGISYVDFKLAASPANIGQEVTQLTFSASYQKKFNISRSIHPYLSIGVGYAQFEAIARHNIDSSGFLSRVYADRKEDLFSIDIGANFEYEINKAFDVGFKLLHRQPLGDGVTDSSIGVAVIYKM